MQLHIHGNGPEAEKIKTLNKSNIFYHGEIDREELNKKLLDYQIVFIPLINRIYGSVPSKIFEQSRLGIPLLYFAGGEGEVLVRNNKLGWTLPVNDKNSLQEFLDQLTIEKLQEYPKIEVQKNALNAFNFKIQFEKLIKEIGLY